MMRMLAVLLIAACLVCGCSSSKTLGGKTYDTYGLINKDDHKSPAVQYEPCWGNVIWGALLFETIIAPIYFFGFDMMEPVDLKEVAPVPAPAMTTPPLGG